MGNRFEKLERIAKVLLSLTSLGLLVLIFYPAYQRLTTPRLDNCQSNLRDIALGYTQYLQDHDNRFPPTGTVSASIDNGWARAIWPYLKGTKRYACYMAQSDSSSEFKSKSFTNYFYNANLSGIEGAEVPDTSNILLAGDGETASSNYSCFSFDRCIGLNEKGSVGIIPLAARTRHIDKQYFSSYELGQDVPKDEKNLYSNGANYAFVDGHIKWLKPEKIAARPGTDIRISFALH